MSDNLAAPEEALKFVPESGLGSIPLYFKTDPDAERPSDPEFYWITNKGIFFCRNHRFFTSDVPANRDILGLAPHDKHCRVRYPKLGRAALEYIVGFFSRIYNIHRSESVALLFWNMRTERYRIVVPEQEADVWESYYGYRSPMDVNYKAPFIASGELIQIGDIHCHGNYSAYASHKDKHDELSRDGIHIVVGHIDQEVG